MTSEGSGNRGDVAAEGVAREIAERLEAAWNAADGSAFAAPFGPGRGQRSQRKLAGERQARSHLR